MSSFMKVFWPSDTAVDEAVDTFDGFVDKDDDTNLMMRSDMRIWYEDQGFKMLISAW